MKSDSVCLFAGSLGGFGFGDRSKSGRSPVSPSRYTRLSLVGLRIFFTSFAVRRFAHRTTMVRKTRSTERPARSLTTVLSSALVTFDGPSATSVVYDDGIFHSSI